MSSDIMSSRQVLVPKVLSLAARVVAVCFLVLQLSIAGVAAKFAGSHPDAGVFCLNQTTGETTPTHPAPAVPVSQHHGGDCCFLSFGDLTPTVIATIAAHLSSPPTPITKPPRSFFIHSGHSHPELSSLAPRAPPVLRV
jgi:hypothetical protein